MSTWRVIEPMLIDLIMIQLGHMIAIMHRAYRLYIVIIDSIEMIRTKNKYFVVIGI